MRALIMFDVKRSDEGGYEAMAGGHSIFTQAESMDDLRTMMADAVRCHFDPESSAPIIRIRLHK